MHNNLYKYPQQIILIKFLKSEEGRSIPSCWARPLYRANSLCQSLFSGSFRSSQDKKNKANQKNKQPNNKHQPNPEGPNLNNESVKEPTIITNKTKRSSFYFQETFVSQASKISTESSASIPNPALQHRSVEELAILPLYQSRSRLYFIFLLFKQTYSRYSLRRYSIYGYLVQ